MHAASDLVLNDGESDDKPWDLHLIIWKKVHMVHIYHPQRQEKGLDW